MSETLPRAVSTDERLRIDLLEWLSYPREVDVDDDWTSIYPTNDDVVKSFARQTKRENLLGTMELERLSWFFGWVCDGEVMEFNPLTGDTCRVHFDGYNGLAEHLACFQYPRDNPEEAAGAKA